MESFNGKKKLTINLSLFTNLADSFSLSSPNKSPRIFQNTSVVGLSIVAAMTNSSNDGTNGNILSSPSRPIPITCSSSAKKQKNDITDDDDDDDDDDHHHHQVDELSESYTCVITHFGNNLVHKRVFFDADADLDVGFEIKREFWSRDFLSSCFLCNKKLHGIDIFMYRGEKAFCSAECRDKQIRSDDRKLEVTNRSFDYSVSPCSGAQPIFAGVVMA